MISCMHTVIQLLGLLSTHYAPLCNREDLIYWQAGFLGRQQNQVLEDGNTRIAYYKRNQLRLRRDLEPLRYDLEKYQKFIVQIISNESNLRPTQSVLKYLCKVTNRLYMMTLVVQMTALNQFRLHVDSFQRTNYDESFHGTIRMIRRFLGRVQYGAMNDIVKNQETRKNFIPSQDTSLSSLMLYMKHLFVEEPTYGRQWGVRLYSNKVAHSPRNYFNELSLCIPSALSHLITSYSRSKLIYLSVIQETLHSELQEVLLNKFIFEDKDPFNYERSCMKIVKM